MGEVCFRNSLFTLLLFFLFPTILRSLLGVTVNATSCLLDQGRPDAGGARSARAYASAGIPTTVVLDAAMGHVMERVDLVLVGAEGVVENGGTVNKVGTFTLGVIAKELGVPLYVAAECYKFTRMYPLNNADLPEMGRIMGGASLKFINTLAWSANDASTKEERSTGAQSSTATAAGSSCIHPHVVTLPTSVSIENPPCDFTPAKYITLLFTDLGVLTPSAVSDELIRLYQ